jgi:MPBQ/MSBQ methyltransferase
VNPDKEHLDAWDKDYLTRGHLWGGSAQVLPDLPVSSHVLELGCGNGKLLNVMIVKGWLVTALDYSRHAICLCRSRHSGSDRVRFLAGDARQLPFRDSSFDAVFISHVTGHLLGPERQPLASETHRVLKPGGQIFFRDFGTGDFRCGKGQQIEENTYQRGYGTVTHYFTLGEVGELFHALVPGSISRQNWHMRVRGEDYQREEIVAVFRKEQI